MCTIIGATISFLSNYSIGVLFYRMKYYLLLPYIYIYNEIFKVALMVKVMYNILTICMTIQIMSFFLAIQGLCLEKEITITTDIPAYTYCSHTTFHHRQRLLLYLLYKMNVPNVTSVNNVHVFELEA